jgi:2-polyprenyl-3-methyl-5-hydroxy-6-metoxy-1,4-benzoquinol methylase
MSPNKRIQEAGWISPEPLPTIEDLEKLYADSYYQNDGSDSKSYQLDYSDDEFQLKKLIAEVELYALKNILDPDVGDNPKLLDIGCGEGFFLDQSAKWGFDICGVDYSDFGVNRFHPHIADKVLKGDANTILESMESEGRKFDICVIRQVLDHLLHPEEMMHQLGRILSPSGLISLTLSNNYNPLQMESLEKGYVESEVWFQPPLPLHYFNIENATRFVQSLGFEVICSFASFPIDLFLLNPHSNYVADKSKGKDAHLARTQFDLIAARNGLENFFNLSSAWADCGLGRNFTLILKPNS